MKALQIFLGSIYIVLILLLVLLNLKGCEDPQRHVANIQVVDADTNDPIRGATVEIITTDEACLEATLTTNRRGKCTFEYSSPNEMLTSAIASKEGYDDASVEDLELAYFEDETLVIPLRRHDEPEPPEPEEPDEPEEPVDTVPAVTPPPTTPEDREDIIDRARRTGQQGRLKVTLEWTDRSIDLDLHVIEPNGFEIYYMELVDRSTGGELDIDWTPQKEECRNRPCAENIYWANPPRGEYVVKVVYYADSDVHRGPSARCNVTIFKEGEAPQVFQNVRLNGPHDEKIITRINI